MTITSGNPLVPLSRCALPDLDPSTPPWPGASVELADLTMFVRHTPATSTDCPAAVYVHGLGGSATNWTDLAAQLQDRVDGHAIDLPGFGRTEPAKDWPFTPHAQAAAVISYIEYLDRGPVHLFGNSLGGLTSVLVATQRPDLVSSLVLVSPAVPDLRPDVRRLADPRLLYSLLPVVGTRFRRELAQMSVRDRAMAMINLCFADPAAIPENRIVEAEHEVAERLTFPWAARALNQASLGMFRAWSRFGTRSLWRELPRIAAPTLVVWGAHDKLVSVNKAPRTTRDIPRARLLTLPDCGHVAQMERPQTVARAVIGMWEQVESGAW